MLRQPPLQSRLIQPPHPLTSNCFLLPPLHGKTGPVGGPEGGSIPLHIGALVVVRSVPPTQEYSSQRAILSSSDPGHSSLPKYSRVASSWHACWPWQVVFTNLSCFLLLSSRMLQLYRTFSEKDNWSELNNHMNHKNFPATLRSIVPI